MSKSDHIENILRTLSEDNFYHYRPFTGSPEEAEALTELCDANIIKYLGGPKDRSRCVYELLWDERPISLAASQDKKNYGNVYTRGEPATWPTI